MTRLVLLSHRLAPDAPVWPTNPPAAAIEYHESIARGHTNNSTRLFLHSHSGTHVDTPWHFNPDGPAAWQLPIETFSFRSPRLIEIPTETRSFMTVGALEPHASTIAEADLLMLRTGWGAQRTVDSGRYASEGPLLHPDAARWLIDRHPRLRAIATDAISIGAPHHPAESVETHHVLTGVGRTDGRFVLIYEDVAMVPDAARATRVHAWPLFVQDADGSPVTIVAEVPD
jgi:arylformamidase